MFDFKSEKGSYTIEACISLFAFLVSIYIVFMQINTLIVENVMQKAVNNIALEISGYSYILDRANIIPEHSEDELEGMNQTVTGLGDIGDTVSTFVTGLFDDPKSVLENPDGTISQAKNIGASLGQFIDQVKGVDWATEIKQLGKNSLEELATAGVNAILTSFYTTRMTDGIYLPQEYDKFCKLYKASDMAVSVRFMPDENNNTVFVSATCKIDSPIKFPGFEQKTIVKVSYSPLWVK